MKISDDLEPLYRYRNEFLELRDLIWINVKREYRNSTRCRFDLYGYSFLGNRQELAWHIESWWAELKDPILRNGTRNQFRSAEEFLDYIGKHHPDHFELMMFHPEIFIGAFVDESIGIVINEGYISKNSLVRR